MFKVDKLIYPMFVKEGASGPEEVSSMPGVYKFSKEALIDEVAYLNSTGLKNILIFGVPENKHWNGYSGYKKNNIVGESVKLIKAKVPDITVMTDVCLCAYTLGGHCGVIKEGNDKIDPSLTLKALSQMALSHAEAGADFVAPSAMAKHQVRAIRQTLDHNRYKAVKILGYSAKFASNFYGPFREIADSAPKFGDRRSYQLDYKTSDGALTRIEQDIKEGADIVMVKPAFAYLDIISQAKKRFNYPLAVYNVSGEYSLIKAGANLGFWDEKKMVFEILNSLKRAGADFIITYHAKDILRWQKEDEKEKTERKQLIAKAS